MSSAWTEPLLHGGGLEATFRAGVDDISAADIRQECVESPVFITRDPDNRGRFTFMGKRLVPPADFMSDNCDLFRQNCRYHPGEWANGGLFGQISWESEPGEETDPHRDILPGRIRGEFWRVPEDQVLEGSAGLGYTAKKGKLLGRSWRCVTRSTQLENECAPEPPGFEFGRFDAWDVPTSGQAGPCDVPIVWKRDVNTGFLQPLSFYRWERQKAPDLENALGKLKSEIRLNTACHWINLPLFGDGMGGYDYPYRSQYFGFNTTGDPDGGVFGPSSTFQKIMSYMGTQEEMPLYLVRVVRNTPNQGNLQVNWMGCRYMDEDDLRAIEHPNVDTIWAGRSLGETLDNPNVGVGPGGVKTSIDHVYYGCQLTVFKTFQAGLPGEDDFFEWSVQMQHRFDLRFRNTWPGGACEPWNLLFQGQAGLLEDQVSIIPVINLLKCYIDNSETWGQGGCIPADPADGVRDPVPIVGSRLATGFNNEVTTFGNNWPYPVQQGVCTLRYYPLNEKEW